MECAGCEIRVSNALAKIEGVTQVSADFSKNEAYITSEKNISDGEIISALENTGYAFDDRQKKSRNAVLYCIAAGVIVLYIVLKKLNLTYILNFFPEPDSSSGYFSLFVIGLLTSFHCIAMCGGINLSQSASAVKNNRSVLKSNIQYQLGRIISYSLIGGAVGALGGIFSVNSTAKGVITAAAGAFMLLMSLNIFGIFKPLRRLRVRLPDRLVGRASAYAASGGSFTIGLLNGFMPCGPLQSMQLYALSAGSFVKGFAAMLLFCLGTIPLLFLFGYFGGRLNQKFSGVMLKISAVIVLLLSLSMLQNGLALAGADIISVKNTDPTVAVVTGDVQTVISAADYSSYEPITVQKGIKVKWTLNVPEGKLIGCNNEIIIPEYGIDAKLSEGDNLIEFTPTQSGTFTFTCWMGMIKSTVTVVDDIDDI